MPWPLSRSRTNSAASEAPVAANATVTPTRNGSERAPTVPRPRIADKGASQKPAASVVSRSAAMPRPPLSPTMSARSGASSRTRASKMEWSENAKGPEVIITRADMRNSLDTYERLLLAAKTYRNAMLSLASATSEFASALEECARQKGAAHTAQPEQPSSLPPFGLDDARSEGQSDKDKGEDADVPAGDLSGSMGEINGEVVEERSSGEKLMAAAGLHHVMSNQQQLLSDTFYKSFEIPLLEKFDSYKQEVQDRQLTYEKETGAKSKMIRDTEAENMRAGRKKQRDLASFRRALLSLQSQVDDLDRIKADYYHEVFAGEQETWSMLSNKVALVVRSQIDSSDRIVTKASSDSVIESMIASILDPFNAYAPAGTGYEEGTIFSILPPLSIASPANSGSHANSPQHPSSGLARTRTNVSSANPASQPQPNGDSPASTARWAEEQLRRRMSNTSPSSGGPEDEVTPRKAPTRRRDQLSWISEGDNDADGGGTEEAAGSAGHDAPVQDSDTDSKQEAADLSHIGMGEDEPRWS